MQLQGARQVLDCVLFDGLQMPLMQDALLHEHGMQHRVTGDRLAAICQMSSSGWESTWLQVASSSTSLTVQSVGTASPRLRAGKRLEPRAFQVVAN